MSEKNNILNDESLKKVTGGEVSTLVIQYIFGQVCNDSEMLAMLMALTPEQQEEVLEFATNLLDGKSLYNVKINYDDYKQQVIDYINQIK